MFYPETPGIPDKAKIGTSWLLEDKNGAVLCVKNETIQAFVFKAWFDADDYKVTVDGQEIVKAEPDGVIVTENTSDRFIVEVKIEAGGQSIINSTKRGYKRGYWSTLPKPY